MARAARKAGARMVHISSVDALGIGTREQPADETTPFGNSIECAYVVTKHESEAAVRDEIEQGLNAVIVNPTYMMGPWDWKPSSGRMLLEVARGRALLAAIGGNNFSDVRDVAAGVLLAAERGAVGRNYILGGDNLSYREAWTQMAEVTGARRPIGYLGPVMRFTAGAFGDLMARVTGREGDINSAAIGMSNLPHYFSSARAEQELGYCHRAAREGFQAAWDWFRANGYA
jgi:dihydroflavonol-4-reductase